MGVARVGRECGEYFTPDQETGRPRLNCFVCVPRGRKQVRLPSGRVKLRRDPYRRRAA